MFNRQILHAALGTILCVGSATAPALANGRFLYDFENGTRCSVTADDVPTFEMTGFSGSGNSSSYSGFNAGHGSNSDYGVEFSLKIPLAEPTKEINEACTAAAKLDQQRSHFDWVLRMYEDGHATRASLEAAAALVGIELAPESLTEPSIDGGVVVVR